MARAVQANVSEMPAAAKPKPATKAKPKPSVSGEQSPPPFEKQLQQLRRGEAQNKAEPPAAAPEPAQPANVEEAVEKPVEQAPSPAIMIVADDAVDAEEPLIATDDISEVPSPADGEPLTPQVAAFAPPSAESLTVSVEVEPATDEPEQAPQQRIAPPAAARIVPTERRSLRGEEGDTSSPAADVVEEPDAQQPVVQVATKLPAPSDAAAQPQPPKQNPNQSPAAAPVEPPPLSGADVRAEHKSQRQPQAMVQQLEASMPPVEDAESPASAVPVVSASKDSLAPQAAPAIEVAMKPPSSSAAPLKLAAPLPPPAPEAHFAQANHTSIVSAVRGQLLPNGGSMQIRLDPPELGALQITVRMLDGVMSASFQTSNDHATQLLSHSLNQLKHGLESQGVSVDKIQVQQSPRDQQASSDEQSRQQHEDDQSARQEQQRKEMLRRMWRRLSIGGDPLDMVA